MIIYVEKLGLKQNKWGCARRKLYLTCRFILLVGIRPKIITKLTVSQSSSVYRQRVLQSTATTYLCQPGSSWIRYIKQVCYSPSGCFNLSIWIEQKLLHIGQNRGATNSNRYHFYCSGVSSPNDVDTPTRMSTSRAPPIVQPGWYLLVIKSLNQDGLRRLATAMRVFDWI